MADQLLILTRGVPASGKSTWAKKWVEQDPRNRVRINRDDIRMEMYGKYVLLTPEGKTDVEAEEAVTAEEQRRLNHALGAGKSVVVDNTNLNMRFLKPYFTAAKRFKVKMGHKDFPISMQEAMKRNRQRDRVVPDRVIQRMYSYLGPQGEFQLFPGSYPVKQIQVPKTREKAIGFDMDGTLTAVHSIRHYVQRPKGKQRDFDSFHRNSLFCPPNDAIVEMLQDAHEAGFKVIITTARGEAYRDVTQAWLDKHNIPYENIFMREPGDMRPDYEVKKDMFDKYVNPHYDLVRQVDDNPQAVQAWVEKGVAVTEVPGFDHTGKEDPVVKIDNLFRRSGVCIRCGRSFKGEGYLGPNCKTKA